MSASRRGVRAFLAFPLEAFARRIAGAFLRKSEAPPPPMRRKEAPRLDVRGD